VPRSTTPGTLRWAIRLLCLQALGVAVVTCAVVYAAFTQRAVTLATSLSTIAVPLALTVLLAVLAWQLYRRRPWARGAAIVLQLLVVLSGATLISSGVPWAGVPVILVALTGAVLLLAPSSREALGIH
jgi:glucose-6-phosphate-specific signal transduction histidine kinase